MKYVDVSVNRRFSVTAEYVNILKKRDEKYTSALNNVEQKTGHKMKSLYNADELFIGHLHYNYGTPGAKEGDFTTKQSYFFEVFDPEEMLFREIFTGYVLKGEDVDSEFERPTAVDLKPFVSMCTFDKGQRLSRFELIERLKGINHDLPLKANVPSIKK